MGYAQELLKKRFSVDLCVRDFGGAKNYRMLWKTQYQSVNGVIFVVDSADQDRLQEVAMCWPPCSCLWTLKLTQYAAVVSQAAEELKKLMHDESLGSNGKVCSLFHSLLSVTRRTSE